MRRPLGAGETFAYLDIGGPDEPRWSFLMVPLGRGDRLAPGARSGSARRRGATPWC